MKKSESKDKKEAAPPDFDCCICLGPISNPCVNVCGHSACSECFETLRTVARERHKIAACPVCRATIVAAPIRLFGTGAPTAGGSAAAPPPAHTPIDLQAARLAAAEAAFLVVKQFLWEQIEKAAVGDNACFIRQNHIKNFEKMCEMAKRDKKKIYSDDDSSDDDFCSLSGDHKRDAKAKWAIIWQEPGKIIELLHSWGVEGKFVVNGGRPVLIATWDSKEVEKFSAVIDAKSVAPASAASDAESEEEANAGNSSAEDNGTVSATAARPPAYKRKSAPKGASASKKA